MYTITSAATVLDQLGAGWISANIRHTCILYVILQVRLYLHAFERNIRTMSDSRVFIYFVSHLNVHVHETRYLLSLHIHEE